MNGTQRIAVFTDLDGCLLDPRTYSFEAAEEALEALRVRGIPLILVSSKTATEFELIRLRLNHSAPFIVENGSALFVPIGCFGIPLEGATLRGPYEVLEFGSHYTKLRAVLKEIERLFGVQLRGFGDMSVGEISERTGLSRWEAMLAKQREYDEPFIMEDSAALVEVVTQQIVARGLRCTRGGRFYHIIGKSDKGRACQVLIACYRREYERMAQSAQLLTIGVGDNANDLSMLRVVDRPVLVQKADGTYDPNIRLPNLFRAEGIGPVGWNQALLQILNSLN